MSFKKVLHQQFRVEVVALVLAACCIGGLLIGRSASAVAPPKTKIDTPVATCAGSGNDYIDIQVCAPSGTGATGLPAGFSIQWMTKEAFDANGGVWPLCTTDDLGEVCQQCKASFSGNANLSRYNLAAGQCAIVRIGEILLDNGASTTCPDRLAGCGHDYVFRVFGHANGKLQRSLWTADLTCSTAECDPGGCDPNVKSFGFWKQHYPDAWPSGVLANGMTVGCQTYTAAELESILLATPAGGNGLVSLAHQVINTKLNYLNGASAAYVTLSTADLAAAEALMCTTGKVPPTGAGTLANSASSGLTLALDTERGAYECP